MSVLFLRGFVDHKSVASLDWFRFTKIKKKPFRECFCAREIKKNAIQWFSGRRFYCPLLTMDIIVVIKRSRMFILTFFIVYLFIECHKKCLEKDNVVYKLKHQNIRAPLVRAAPTR